MINFFQIFSLPIQFAIDKEQLRKKYFSLQIEYHPDKFVKADEAEKIKALQMSADINEGFKILSDDLLRAEHLLALAGIIVNKDRNNTYSISKELLLEQMELRERVDELNYSPDNVTPHSLRGGSEYLEQPSTPQQVRGDTLSNKKLKLCSEILQKIEQAIESFEESYNKQNFEKAAEAVTRLRYLAKIND